MITGELTGQVIGQFKRQLTGEHALSEDASALKNEGKSNFTNDKKRCFVEKKKGITINCEFSYCRKRVCNEKLSCKAKMQ